MNTNFRYRSMLFLRAGNRTLSRPVLDARAGLCSFVWISCVAFGVGWTSPDVVTAVEQITAARVIAVADAPNHPVPAVTTAISLDPSGRRFATASDDHIARIWDAETGQLLHSLPGHEDWVRQAAFDRGGTQLATAGQEQCVKIWDAATGRQLRSLHGAPQGTSALCFCPATGHVVVAGYASQLCIFDGQTGRKVRQWAIADEDVRQVLFSPDGSIIASTGRSGRICLWDAATGTLLHEMPGDGRRAMALAFSPDGSHVASGGDGLAVTLWNVQSGTAALQLPVRPAKVFSLEFCGPHLLAVGGSDNRVRIWDLSTAREVKHGVGHTGTVAALAYDPTRNRLFSASFDTTVRIWNLSSSITPYATQHPAPESLWLQ